MSYLRDTFWAVIYVSPKIEINAFELYRGAYKSQNQEKNLASVKGLLNSLYMLNTDEDSMEIAGKITARLERGGNMIDIRDLLIASIALVNGFGVLTNNVRHFNRVPHLRVVGG